MSSPMGRRPRTGRDRYTRVGCGCRNLPCSLRDSAGGSTAKSYGSAGEGDWIKSLLLFFDDVAILLPGYMRGRHRDADPSLARPLEDRGLLRVLEPNEWIDAEVAERLAEIVVELLAEGVFDGLPEVRYFAELSRSRMGYGADFELAEFLVDELRQRGLARESEDSVAGWPCTRRRTGRKRQRTCWTRCPGNRCRPAKEWSGWTWSR